MNECGYIYGITLVSNFAKLEICISLKCEDPHIRNTHHSCSPSGLSLNLRYSCIVSVIL